MWQSAVLEWVSPAIWNFLKTFGMGRHNPGAASGSPGPSGTETRLGRKSAWKSSIHVQTLSHVRQCPHIPNPHQLMGLTFSQITCQVTSHVSIRGNLGFFYRWERPRQYFMMQLCQCTDSFAMFLLVWCLGRHRTRNFRDLSVLVSPGLKKILILGGDHMKQAENPSE